MRERLLEHMRLDAYKPLNVEEIAAFLEIETSEQFQELYHLLAELEETGEIVRTRVGRYGVPGRMNLVVGRMELHNKGFGFVLPDNPDEPDVFIPADALVGAMNNDRVIARIHAKEGNGRKREGQIVRILKRATDEVVGTFVARKQFGRIRPDDVRFPYDIIIPAAEFHGAKDGQKVVAKITVWPENRNSAEGKVKEVLGFKDDPGVDIVSIIKKHHLPLEFPSMVLHQAEAVADQVGPDDLDGRQDLRDELIVTIDGEDAKDLDDAVSVVQLSNGQYRLGVHIADVSYYVRPGSKLDKEAFERGTSVYLVDRVLPMLPQRLSNGICSLNPRIDRLTMSAVMDINSKGQIVKYKIFPSVIKTHSRLTYTLVNQLLAGNDEELRREHSDLLPMLQTMQELRDILRSKRMRRGAIDFDFPEYKVVLDEQGKPLEIQKRVHALAESIIEEFMLAANETVARHIEQAKIPGMYRVHEQPEEEKMGKLNELLGTFGLMISDVRKVRPKELQALLSKISGRPEERVISTVMLRSLKQARYESENLGHFGLAAEYYTHFTSPIRRYPDLVVHRILRTMLRYKKLPEAQIKKWAAKLPEVASHCSVRERLAADAEHETQDYKKAEYMERHIGDEFEGIISSVTAFGMFVELDNGVEGLIHVSTLTDDYYHFREQNYSLLGERTRKLYKIGDPIRIIVKGVNRLEGTIDFERAEQPAEAGHPLKHKHRKNAGHRNGSASNTAVLPPRIASGNKKHKRKPSSNGKTVSAAAPKVKNRGKSKPKAKTKPNAGL